MYIKAKHLHIK